VRRLYGVLQRKNQEIAQLNEAGKKSAKGRSTSQASERRSPRAHSPRGDSTLPGVVSQGRDRGDNLSAPRSPRDSCGAGALFSPRKQKEGGQLQNFRRLQEQHQAEYLKFLQERAGLQDQSPRSPRDGKMPQVFRRLTAPATPPSEQMARIAVANMGANKAQVSFGGPLAESTDASGYLDALLEAHQADVATRGEDIGNFVKQSPRVSEDKAREIFDRLYKNGKDARIRRRVYAELGLLVEQAKEAQMCTFEPQLPLARYPDGFQPHESINERLYRDSFDRRRRREEAKQSVPMPPFRPNMSVNSTTSRRSEGMSPRDTLSDAGFGDSMSRVPTDGSMVRKSSTHERLFRDHADRKARQAHREDVLADWRKHTFKPDIATSQATGPVVARTASFFEQMERSRTDEDGFPTRAPARMDTHPAFEQELSDEEELKLAPQDSMADLAESPNFRENSSMEVASPIDVDMAASYKLNPAAQEALEAEIAEFEEDAAKRQSAQWSKDSMGDLMDTTESLNFAPGEADQSGQAKPGDRDGSGMRESFSGSDLRECAREAGASPTLSGSGRNLREHYYIGGDSRVNESDLGENRESSDDPRPGESQGRLEGSEPAESRETGDYRRANESGQSRLSSFPSDRMVEYESGAGAPPRSKDSVDRQGQENFVQGASVASSDRDGFTELGSREVKVEMPAADKLSAVCQELKAEAGELPEEPVNVISPETNLRTPDMYLHPQAADGARNAAVHVAHVPQQRRQWVQQLPAAAVHSPSPGSAREVTRQDSTYSLGGGSPALVHRNFSGNMAAVSPRSFAAPMSPRTYGMPMPMAPAHAGHVQRPVVVPNPVHVPRYAPQVMAQAPYPVQPHGFSPRGVWQVPAAMTYR